MSLTIQLPEAAEKRLREEAARRNATVEMLAAQLLTDQLQVPLPAEADVTPGDAQFFVDAVHQARAAKSNSH